VARQSTLRILHLIYEQGRPEGPEVATATALHARRVGDREVQVWAPKEIRAIPEVVNRAREGGVFHRGPHSALALRGHILRERIDVVHCHDSRAAITMGFLEFTGHMPPVILSVYRPLAAPTPGRPILEGVRRLGLWALKRSVDAVVVPSTFARGVVLSQGAFDDANVWKVTYGASQRPAGTTEGEDGVEVGVLLLPVENARAQRRTAYYYFLQAAQIVLRQTGPARFLIVCPRGDRSYVDSMAARFSIRDEVTVLGESDFPACLGRCGVAVLPTGDFQGVRPLVLALASGMAVVGPDLRGVREFIRPEETGLLVRPSDSQALADALRRLVSSDSARRAVSTAGRAAAKRHFSPARMARELSALYARLAD
jgi:glycosyltransferase involved in cell wall biosynthesis